MTNEEFQRIVLEELKGLREGQKNLEMGFKNLEKRQEGLQIGFKNLEKQQESLENGQKEVIDRLSSLEKTVNAIHEQTVELTEFRSETKEELEDIKTTISRIEIATAENWSDLAKLKSIRLKTIR